MELNKKLSMQSAILLLVVVLLVLSVVMVYSASSFKAQERFEDSHYFLKRHFYKVLAAFLLMLLVSRIHYDFWLKISPFLVLLCLGMLLFLLISPSAPKIKGSKRWLTLLGVTFQPSDFSRMMLILFLSLSLGRANYFSHEPLKRFLLHFFVISAITLPIFLQPDIGTGTLVTFIAITLVFVSGEKLRYLFIPALTVGPVVFLMILRNSYIMERIKAFIDAIKGTDIPWQTQQSLIALGNGSLTGLGLGGSKQKYHFLPEPFTDFIFAIIGEELGILGTIGTLILVLILIRYGFRISVMAPELASKLLAFGITFNIAVYTFTNVAVVVNLLPVTGIPAPFLSYGGSALFMNLFGIGILLNISQRIHQDRLIYPVRNHHTRPRRRFRYGK